MSSREEGRLSQWNDAKGYGFITPDGGGDRLFVHISAFAPRPRRPCQGERISYEPGHDAQGKRRALRVRGLTVSTPALSRRHQADKPGNATLWLVPGFAFFFLLCQLRWPMPPAVWGAYMAMSLATFIVYAGDKRAARLGRWRVAENTLHGLALACGWPGALLARQLLRHKSDKPRFVRLFWLTVVLNWIGFTLIFTPLLQRWMR
jgi:uncharacterized membrane protein YsdA (DUF1294 family)/cold shock CspA family protein